MHRHSMVTIFVATDLKLRRARARIRDVEERGKPLAEFEGCRHFVEIGERRWGLAQQQAADCILDIHHTFSYDAFFHASILS
ncbi:hypothetical protein [Dictyobacter arantiisoli]|uniref:hypothetical protein n=1 Tax=Dictyobacter arantiisoli TaxID=2014874 RepID=UPI0011F00471|nr:hypothetical protein [Dictyobacter arantiisoli]